MFTTKVKPSSHAGTKVPFTMGLSFMVALLVLAAAPSRSFAFQTHTATIRSRRIPTAFHVDQSSQRSRLATAVKYRDNMDQDATTTATWLSQQRWWSKLKAPLDHNNNNSAEDAETRQAVVDDYLTFLDRRYNRLHEDEYEQRPRCPELPKFSAWKWLTQGADDDDASAKSQPAKLAQPSPVDQENALYVLGVASLASQKLLQKHHLPLPEQKQRRATAAASVPVQATTVTPIIEDEPSSTVAAKLTYVLRRISLQRKLLLRYQTQKLQALAQVLLRTIKAGPGKVVKKMMQLGGGSRTMALTLTVVSAVLVFVVGPLAQAVVSEGAQHHA